MTPDASHDWAGLGCLTRAQSQWIDRVAIDDFGFSGLMLMENAASGAARCLLARRQSADGGVMVVCGGGNNGGDGLAMARHLHIAAVGVGVILVADEAGLRQDSAVQWRIVQRTAIPTAIVSLAGLPAHERAAAFARRWEIAVAQIQERLGNVTWIVDAMLGTGAQGPLRWPWDLIVRQLNAWAGVRRMALDLPTGWDCDLGPCGADVFQADLTYTMVAGKKSFPQPGVTSSLGEVVIGDIGIPPELIAQVMAGPPSVE